MFTKGGGPWLEPIAASGADVVGLDWTVEPGRRARERVGSRVALQGNLDPMVLFGGEAAVRAEARRVLDDFGVRSVSDGGHDGHIFNLGHGINQHTPPEAVAALVDEVHRSFAHARRMRLASAAGK